MQVMVTFRHVDPSEGLRTYAEEKVQRVRKYLRRPIEAHVTLSVEKNRHIAEVQVSANHLKVMATEETADLYSAIDLAMSKLERQIEKHVARYKDHNKGGNSGTPAEGGTTAARATAAVEIRRVAVKPMSIDEAVLELRLHKTDFLLFRNSATDALCAVYRRKNGNYVVVEPEPR